MLLAEGRPVGQCVNSSQHVDHRQNPHQYNGIPLISYNSAHRSKKKRGQNTARQGKSRNYQPLQRGFNQMQNHPGSWEDYHRCMEFVGEPLVIVPRSGRLQQFYPVTYGYPLMTYSDYFHPPTHHLPIPASHHQHRESFSSCSSSDTASSGSSSPVHFSNTNQENLGNALHGCEAHTNSPKREWISKSSPDAPEVSLGITLRVMSYNILSEQYAKNHWYCPKWAMAISYRRERIREDIEMHSPDVACLQEVTMGEFYNYFLDNLRVQGYTGIFSPKSRAHTMGTKDRQVVDGCAIVFRNDRFDLINQHLVEFNQLAIKNAEGSNDMINRVMTKDNIALCAVLRVTESVEPSYVLVINAHVHWDPAFSDVKLIQTMLLMCEVEKLVQKSKLELAVEDIPIIFCGDLNSLPDSGVIEFLRRGRVSVDHPDFKDLPYRNCLQKLSSQGHLSPEGQFLHPFGLNSAYDDGDLPFTNYTADFRGVIDYIFLSGNKIQTLGVLGPIESSWLEGRKPVGFPCPQIPSDHLPLVVEIELTL